MLQLGKIVSWPSVIGGLTGMDFDLFFFPPPPPSPPLYSIYIEELALPLAHPGLACKIVLARVVPRDSTRALDLIIEIKPRPHLQYYLSVGLLKRKLFSLVEGLQNILLPTK